MISDDAKRIRAEYQRKYRRKNPDKVRRWQENHWNKVASELRPKESNDNAEQTNTKD